MSKYLLVIEEETYNVAPKESEISGMPTQYDFTKLVAENKEDAIEEVLKYIEENYDVEDDLNSDIVVIAEALYESLMFESTIDEDDCGMCHNGYLNTSTEYFIRIIEKGPKLEDYKNSIISDLENEKSEIDKKIKRFKTLTI
jgi:hypothetical protein